MSGETEWMSGETGWQDPSDPLCPTNGPISIHLNTDGRYWADVLDRALHHCYQNIKWGKNGVHPSRDSSKPILKLFLRIIVAQHLTRTLHVGKRVCKRHNLLCNCELCIFSQFCHDASFVKKSILITCCELIKSSTIGSIFSLNH